MEQIPTQRSVTSIRNQLAVNAHDALRARATSRMLSGVPARAVGQMERSAGSSHTRRIAPLMRSVYLGLYSGNPSG